MLEEICQKKQDELNKMGPLEEISLSLKGEDSVEVEKAKGYFRIILFYYIFNPRKTPNH